MIKTSIWEVQKALFTRLKETEYKIFDYVEHSTEYPYIVIGTTDKKECYEMLNNVLIVLSKKFLKLDGGFEIFKTEMLNLNVIDDIDGRTQHGILRLKFYIKEG